jgi:subtilisin family serine protease
MSLGATQGALNEIVRLAIEAGLTFTVAAGNSRLDACTVSPAMVPGAITVAATTIEDEFSEMVDLRSKYSNFGPCVSVFAPG